jgi:transcriptional regulator with XRE-family HTH domain
MSQNDLGVFAGLSGALRRLRTQRGWTFQELSDRIAGQGQRVTAANLNRYEKGRSVPSLSTLARVLGTLEVSLEELAAVLRDVRGEPQDPDAYLVVRLPHGTSRTEVRQDKALLDHLVRAVARVDELFPEITGTDVEMKSGRSRTQKG